ncbi:hypothetical protein CVV38_02865 [Candidatus Peregrinibacteria bacterium HGW-Peregrinibacteria-1]|jgi:murein DD-endopeptidase MepM/ murein hydrolase activator NlpD|nr:MAG: hypothetical protein CVV38_02865 [Candidatus Peregrinibacteria bacterium HGW-Peregrinibacteria-1]
MSKKVSTKRVWAIRLLASVAVFGLSLMAFNVDFRWAMTSLVSVPAHEPFDGTTYPVKHSPIWTKLNSTEYKQLYDYFSSSKLEVLPTYNPSELARSTDSLAWGNSAHDAIRNAKITYSVPYMGNYRLDGQEYAGSHLAVDIKIPTGTPIYAMANGTVIKVSNQTSGFGQHIVIQHNNFPTLENSNAKTVLYSSYSHLSSTLVSEGTVVKKGAKIGLSGASGTATTPHLHFQIDNAEAPWHPFWPFTTQEAYNQGLDFFSAVNAGLGKELAMKSTVNPMLYVQKYMNGSSDSYVDPVYDDSNNSGEDNSGTDSGSYADELDDYGSEDSGYTEAPVVIPDEPKELRFKFETRREYYVGKDSPFTIYLKDQYGGTYDDGFRGDLIIKTDRSLATSQNSIINAMQFRDGKLESGLKNLREGRDRLTVEYEGTQYYSEWFDVVGTNKSDDMMFSDISSSHPNYEAIVYLAERGIVSGHPDGTFRPAETVNRAEALKFIFAGSDDLVKSEGLPFTDTDNSAWYADYLYTGYQKGVIGGHPDGSYRPGDTVNKAEFLKMLFNGMGVEVPSGALEKPYSDVRTTDWFASYFEKAKQYNVIDRELRFVYPGTGMTRGDVAQGIYNLLKNLE